LSKKKRGKDKGLSLKTLEPVSLPAIHPPFPVKHLLAIGLMAIITLAAYANTFRVPFQFDDAPNIVSNPSIAFRTLSVEWFEQLIKLNSDSIRVFSYFTFALNHHFGGLNVFGYHLVNFLIHLSSGLLFYWFLLLTFNLPSLKERYGSVAFPIALFSSLIFLVHPIQTQSVTYIVQRMASMAGAFYLLTMVLYIKGRLSSGQKRLLFWAGAVLSYLLGLFTKENVAILPLFVALYELYFFQNFDLGPRGKKTLLLSIGMVLFVGILIFFLWGMRYVNVIIEGYQTRDFTLLERVLTQFRVVLYYVTLLVYPHPSRLNLDYDFATSHGLLDPPTTLVSILIVVGLIGYSVWVARRRPLFSYFALWYFGNLVIESSIFPLEMVFEHRLYLPMIGPIVLFVVFVLTAWERIRTRVGRSSAYLSNLTRTRITDTIIWGFFPAVTVLLVWGSYDRNKVWGDTLTLWQDCVKKSPKKQRPHFNLGQRYYEAGRYNEAIASYQAALRLKPNDELAYNSLGLAYTAIGAYPEAVAALEKALRIKPAFALALANLGYAYSAMNRYPEAIELFKKVVQLTPDDPEALNNLGVAYRKMGGLADALGVYRSALRLNPDSSDAYNNIGLAYADLNQYPEAVESFKKALQLKPDDAQAVNNLGVVYRKMGRMEEAMRSYRDALRIKPEFPDACNNLGLSLYGLHRYPEAVKAFQEAIRLKPKEGEYHYNLGVTQTALGDYSAALQSYREAVRINPGHVKARFNLALTFLTLKNHDLALEQYHVLKGLDSERAQRLLILLNSNK
jgi:protein O-mannosyl-transferase